ncbi:MAG: tetratricopeptide repeat protein [Bacteroidales bacterium]|nr:tetratricopeptide repeat protein [Bacteroidales bacterium]
MKTLCSLSLKVGRGALMAWLFVIFSVFSLSGQNPTQSSIDSLVRVTDTISNDEKKLENFNQITSFYLNFNPTLSYEYAIKTRELATRLSNEKYLLQSLKNLTFYYIKIAQYDSSILLNFEALELARKLGDLMLEAHLLRDQGRVFYLQGKYPESLEVTFKAVTIFEDLDDATGLATTYNSIGNIYLAQEKKQTSIEYYSKALDYCRKINNEVGIITVIGSLAANYAQIDSTEKAIAYYTQAIEQARKIDLKMAVALNLNNLALMYLEQNDYQKGTELFWEAHHIHQTLNDNDGIALTLGNIGLSYYRSIKLREQGDTISELIRGEKADLLKNAIKYLTQSVEIYEQLGSLAPLAYFANELSEAYEAAGNHREALKYFKLHDQYHDSIQSNESKIQLEKLTTQRELELKDKQIELDRLAVQKKKNERIYFIFGMILLAFALVLIYRNFALQKSANSKLTLLNGQISQANLQLEESNVNLSATLRELKETQAQLIETEKQKEKAIIRERISQDIHDDISSGLTKISWMAELLKVKSKDHATPYDLTTLDKIVNFSKESVAKLGEIIWSTNPERDNVGSLLAYMRNFINKYMEGLPMECKISFPEVSFSDSISPELRRTLYLVMKESLHNAVKYSGAKNIEITFNQQNQHYTLIVADSGKGFEENLIKGGGNGLLNMRKRMESVGGTMEIQTGSGEGTQVIFTGKLH